MTSQSWLWSSMAPSVILSDGEASGVGDIQLELVVSNEYIVVGVPPMLDEPFDQSFWRVRREDAAGTSSWLPLPNGYGYVAEVFALLVLIHMQVQQKPQDLHLHWIVATSLKVSTLLV